MHSGPWRQLVRSAPHPGRASFRQPVPGQAVCLRPPAALHQRWQPELLPHLLMQALAAVEVVVLRAGQRTPAYDSTGAGTLRTPQRSGKEPRGARNEVQHQAKMSMKKRRCQPHQRHCLWPRLGCCYSWPCQSRRGAVMALHLEEAAQGGGPPHAGNVSPAEVVPAEQPTWQAWKVGWALRKPTLAGLCGEHTLRWGSHDRLHGFDLTRETR
jgi:hypothetical protein